MERFGVKKSSAKSVNPYSAVGETGANVPCLKHFFPMTEQSGTQITDIKSGVVWDIAINGDWALAPEEGVFSGTPAALVFNRAGSSKTVATNVAQSADPIPLKRGGWHVFNESKALIVLCAGRVAFTRNGDHAADSEVNTFSTRFALGDTNAIVVSDGTAHGLGMSNTSEHHAFIGKHIYGTNQYSSSRVSVNASAPLNYYPDGTVVGITTLDSTDPITFIGMYHEGEDLAWKIVQEPSTTPTFVVSHIDTDTAIINAPEIDLDASNRMNGTGYSWQPSPYMRFAHLAAYGYAVFEFANGLPSDHVLACRWMQQEWKRGNRVIWPGWIGVA